MAISAKEARSLSEKSFPDISQYIEFIDERIREACTQGKMYIINPLYKEEEKIHGIYGGWRQISNSDFEVALIKRHYIKAGFHWEDPKTATAARFDTDGQRIVGLLSWEHES